MIPNNNLSVLPFYTSIEQQNARKWWVYNRIYPLFTPANMLLPFQIMRNHKVLGALDERIPAEYIYRKSDPRLGNGPIQITKILGKTLVWNQHLKNADFVSTDNWIGSNLSVLDNVLTTEITATSGTHVGVSQILSISPIEGHLYYLAGEIKTNDNSSGKIFIVTGNLATGLVVQRDGINNEFVRLSDIKQCINVVTRLAFGQANARSGVILQIKNVRFIDLTLMFGEGNEPTSVEDFERDYKYILDNPAYNAGEIKNNETQSIQTTGFNQWDEQWESGTLDWNDGSITADSQKIRSKNFIDVFHTTYFINVVARIFEYDADKNFITSYAPSLSTGQFTPNCRYIKFSTEGTTYNNDICLNFSNVQRNGQYEPYVVTNFPLNLDSFSVKDAQGNIVTINGLKKAGSAYDEIVGKKYIQRVGVVDMGTLNYSFSTGTRFVATFGEAKIGSFPVCSKYITVRPDDIVTNVVDKAVAMSRTTKALMVRDTDYNDAATFKSAMAGVMLNYELATPIEYEIIDTPPAGYPKYKGELYGTEKALYNNELPLVPLCYEATPYRLLLEFKIFKSDGTELADYTEQMNRMLAVKTIDDVDVLVYAANIPLTPLFPNGQYYAVMSDGLNVWYSEVFTAVNDIQPYLKIEWWDTEDFVMDAGLIVYREPNFKNVLYLDSDLAKPEYPFEEEGETRDGYFFPIKQISEKHYRFKFFASEYLLDVMRFIRMADYARITYRGQTYSLDTFLITPEWEDNGDVASVEAEFDTATVAKKIGRGYIVPTGGDFNDDFNNDFNNQE